MVIETDYFKQWEQHFKQYRPFLTSFTFRMTGSLSEAEDIVQDSFLECVKINPIEVQNPKAWLTKVCSNKGLDHLKSAYKRRETYPGVWLPDAIPDRLQEWDGPNETGSPEKALLASESLTTTFLLLLERLIPEERVVYLLAEIFEYSFKDIAEFLGKSEAACRKTAERARNSVATNKPKFEKTTQDSLALIARFFASAKAGDQDALKSLLAEDSELWSDGGGKVQAAASVLKGAVTISAFFKFIGSMESFNSESYKLDPAFVSQRPGLIISQRLTSGLWVFETIFSFEFKEEKLVRIYAQRNPDKLQALVSS